MKLLFILISLFVFFFAVSALTTTSTKYRKDLKRISTKYGNFEEKLRRMNYHRRDPEYFKPTTPQEFTNGIFIPDSYPRFMAKKLEPFLLEQDKSRLDIINEKPLEKNNQKEIQQNKFHGIASDEESRFKQMGELKFPIIKEVTYRKPIIIGQNGKEESFRSPTIKEPEGETNFIQKELTKEISFNSNQVDLDNGASYQKAIILGEDGSEIIRKAKELHIVGRQPIPVIQNKKNVTTNNTHNTISLKIVSKDVIPSTSINKSEHKINSHSIFNETLFSDNEHKHFTINDVILNSFADKLATLIKSMIVESYGNIEQLDKSIDHHSKEVKILIKTTAKDLHKNNYVQFNNKICSTPRFVEIRNHNLSDVISNVTKEIKKEENLMNISHHIINKIEEHIQKSLKSKNIIPENIKSNLTLISASKINSMDKPISTSNNVNLNIISNNTLSNRASLIDNKISNNTSHNKNNLIPIIVKIPTIITSNITSPRVIEIVKSVNNINLPLNNSTQNSKNEIRFIPAPKIKNRIANSTKRANKTIGVQKVSNNTKKQRTKLEATLLNSATNFIQKKETFSMEKKNPVVPLFDNKNVLFGSQKLKTQSEVKKLFYENKNNQQAKKENEVPLTKPKPIIHSKNVIMDLEKQILSHIPVVKKPIVKESEKIVKEVVRERLAEPVHEAITQKKVEQIKVLHKPTVKIPTAPTKVTSIIEKKSKPISSNTTLSIATKQYVSPQIKEIKVEEETKKQDLSDLEKEIFPMKDEFSFERLIKESTKEIKDNLKQLEESKSTPKIETHIIIDEKPIQNKPINQTKTDVDESSVISDILKNFATNILKRKSNTDTI